MSNAHERTVKCPHCGGRRVFKTLPGHPRGADHDVPCSRCAGQGQLDESELRPGEKGAS